MATSALADAHDIVEWLKGIEELVGSLYARAAKTCGEDTEFSSFLSQLAKDEDSHSEYMSNILSHLTEIRPHSALDIALDSKARDRVESPLSLSSVEMHLVLLMICLRLWRHSSLLTLPWRMRLNSIVFPPQTEIEFYRKRATKDGLNGRDRDTVC